MNSGLTLNNIFLSLDSFYTMSKNFNIPHETFLEFARYLDERFSKKGSW